MSATASVWDLCNKFTKHMPTYKNTGVSQLYFLKWIAYRDMEQNKHGELSHIYLWCILPVCIFLKLRVSKILDKHICKKILKSLNYIVTLNKLSMTYLDWTQGLDFSFAIFVGKTETTVATDELLCLKNAGAQISMFFTSNE